MSKSIFFILLLAVALPGWGREAAPAVADPQLEKRVMALAGELRCLVCQNQSIADSSAPLAVDLKDQIREKMQQGMNESDIIGFMVARYGDFVLYRPPIKLTTLLLWFGPLLLMLIGMGMLVYRLARRRTAAAAFLTEAERARAAALLKGGEGGAR